MKKNEGIYTETPCYSTLETFAFRLQIQDKQAQVVHKVSIIPVYTRKCFSHRISHRLISYSSQVA